MNQFPWFKNGYKHIYDQLDYTEQGKTSVMRDQYPSSEVSDRKIILKPKDKDETQPPEKILIVSTNGSSIDQLILLAESFELHKTYKLLRIGHSLSNEALNRKYSIDHIVGSLA